MILSDHFKHSLKLLGVIAILLLGGFFWLKHRIAGVIPGLLHPPRAVLPQNIKERVSFNEKTHVLTVTTHKSSIRAFARNPNVSITNSGDVIVGKHLTGFENDWFMGVGYADCGRIFIGDNLYYFGRFDLFGTVGIATNTSNPLIRPYIGVGYNLWSNTSLNLAVNPVNVVLSYLPQIAGFVSVRF